MATYLCVPRGVVVVPFYCVLAGFGAPGHFHRRTMTLQMDLSGLKCPLPLLRTKKKLAELLAGDLLEVVATDPHSREDFHRYCDGGVCSVLSIEQQDNRLVIVLRKEGGA